MRGFAVALLLILFFPDMRADGPCGDGCGGCGWDPDVIPAHFMITGTKNVPGYTFLLIYGDGKKQDTVRVKDSVAYTARGNRSCYLLALSADGEDKINVTRFDKHDDVFILNIVGQKTHSNGSRYIDYDRVYTSKKELKKAAKAGFVDGDRLPPPLVFLFFSIIALGFFVRLWRQRKKAA